MILTSWTYAVFLAIAVSLGLVAPLRLLGPLLLVVSAVFYGWGAPRDLVIVGAVLAVTHFVARRVEPGQPSAKRWLVAGVGGSVGLLAYYKYLNLGIDAVNYMTGRAGTPEQWVATLPAAPLGISFFIFLTIHYLVEVYRGRVAPVGAGAEAGFVLFFPTVVSGPLKRVESFLPQVRNGTRASADDLHEGLSRIIIGLAKKTLVADQIAPLCTQVFADPAGFDRADLWLASYGYAVQIYFDFSGYSDIAIGSARMLGIRVPENFDYPYFRTNIVQFWRHWHMTLTGWIMEYVYIPLGGNRRGEWRTNGNRLAAMALCGLWHGSAVHFAVWGAYHGLLLNLFHLYRRVRARLFPDRPEGLVHPLARTLSGLLTFHLVVVGWLFFVADIGPALSMIGRMVFLAGP